MTQFAVGSRHVLSYVAESEFGVTPPTPMMKRVRHTSCSLMLTKESLQSAELRPDSQVSDLRHGNRQSGGDVGIEFSFGDYDDFLAAAVRGSWSSPDADGISILKAGTELRSFSMERGFTDVEQYQQFVGVQINTFSLSIQPNAMITGTIGTVGLGVSFNPTLDPDPDDTRGGAPLDGFSGALKEGGSTITTVTGIELSIDNGKTPAFVLGSPVASNILNGNITITGTLTTFFEDMSMLSKFVDEEESSIEVILGDGLFSSYVLTLPRVKYSGGDIPVDGEGAVVVTMPFQALFDECEGTNIIIKRLPAETIEPCELTYGGNTINESATSPGQVTEVVDILLTGGVNKIILGNVGAEVPGTTITGVPEGLTGQVIKTSATSAELRLVGTADSAITDTPMTITFTAASFVSGYCNCPNGSMTNTTYQVTLLPA